MGRVVRVPFEGDVVIEINDEDVIERVTGPGGDEWRSYAYGLHTEADVLSHLAYNALMNGVTGVDRLDGWGDMKEDAVKMYVDHDSLFVGR